MAIESLRNDVQMATVLKKIVADKAIWIDKRKIQQPLSSFINTLKQSDRDFYQALVKPHSVFILECKKASPSKGMIRDDFDPKKIASIYNNYADAISVLTDEKYFQGSFDFLPIVKQQTHQPILCKDFIIDEYQIYLARYYQADAILLMLSVLNDKEYQHLSEIAHRLGMGILTEASTDHEVERAINLNAKVIGINNRNLRDLTVDLNRVKHLAPMIPKDRIIISESGIYSHQQVLELSQYAQGFLIGSALMSENDLELAIRKVMLGENKICGLTSVQDAVAAYHAGAIYGGLIFVPESPRYISRAKAEDLILSSKLNWVGVFRNKPIDAVVNTVKSLHLFAVQLHGNEDEHYLTELRTQLPNSCQIWQAISIGESIPQLNNPLVNRYILDNGQGGSGKTFNWQLLQNRLLDKVILAGGINPENAQQAIQTGVIGIDINSGVEISPGIKDQQKITKIFNVLRNYPYLNN